MPRLDGAGLIAQLRARRPDLPVVVMTGEMVPRMVVVEPSQARTTVLSKPVKPSLLLNALRASMPDAVSVRSGLPTGSPAGFLTSH